MDLPRYDIHIIEGEDFVQEFRLKESDGTYKDLSGYVAESQIRETYEETSELLRSLTCEIDGEVLRIKLSYIETADIADVQRPTSARHTVGFYDVFIKSPIEDYRRYFIGGKVNYTQTITKV